MVRPSNDRRHFRTESSSSSARRRWRSPLSQGGLLVRNISLPCEREVARRRRVDGRIPPPLASPLWGGAPVRTLGGEGSRSTSPVFWLCKTRKNMLKIEPMNLLLPPECNLHMVLLLPLHFDRIGQQIPWSCGKDDRTEESTTALSQQDLADRRGCPARAIRPGGEPGAGQPWPTAVKRPGHSGEHGLLSPMEGKRQPVSMYD